MEYHRSKDKILSKIGYYNDQKGIINRYLRESRNWTTHIEKTKKAILDGMINKERRKVLVLGSGWLLDVPVKELSEAFEQVWLADVYHPPQVVKNTSRMNNVMLIQTELTGLADQVYHVAKVFRKTKYKTPVSDFKPVSAPDFSSYDYVVSCNILSQLDIILADHLRKYNLYTEDEVLTFRKLVQQSHIGALPNGKTTLVCDVEEWIMDDTEKVSEKRPLLHVPLPGIETMRSWVWKFDTKMTYYPGFKTYFKVASVSF